MKYDSLVNTVLDNSQQKLLNLFEGMFAEEIEGEQMQELIAQIQLYCGSCMRAALQMRRENEQQ